MDINSISNEIRNHMSTGVREAETRNGSPVTNKGNEVKQDYLELAVGTKEDELKRLGLTDEEDGMVTMKKQDADMTPWERIQKDEEEKENEEQENSQNVQCETCANRKYQDGSDEMVSFKSATHIAPEAAAAQVRAHEQEHVVNAYEKAEAKGGEVQSASVAIHTSICPECGRVYVSGGTTTTSIRYNDDNYAANAKKQDATVLPGAKVDKTL